MASITMVPLAVTAGFLGVLTHLTYFIYGEHHLHAMRIIQLSFLAPCLMFIGLFQYGGVHPLKAFNLTTATWWAFFGSLWMSMLIYRAFFHRLGTYPGPFMARLSAFWHSKQGLSFRNYEKMDALHQEYGEYVRIGPAEISITDPEAVELVHGARTTCVKSPWYDLAHPYKSAQMERNKAIHAQRRRSVWDRAFSSKALRTYDPVVAAHADLLLEKLSASSGKPTNVAKWFNFYTADTLGQLAFGKSYDMLKTGSDHWTIKLLQDGSKFLALFSTVCYILPLLEQIPYLGQENTNARLWCEEQVEKRKKMDIAQPDIMTWFLDPLEPMSEDPKMNDMWLSGDARLVVIAGTDTTTATLSYAMYHMAKDPRETQKIRDELLAHNIDKEFSIPALQSCEYLNAFIDETLRLHPPVPSGVSRMTPPQGLKIGDHFVPGDIQIAMPTYTIHRSPKAFVDPNSFIPERWTTSPELVKNKRVFMPFNLGAYSCVGKQLALAETRTVISKLVLAFDITFAPGEDGTNLLQKTQDYFVLGLADLNLIFTPRAG